MHRTTTTATLLVTVAVSALAGCVTVQRPTAAVPSQAPSRPSAPRPDGSADPQIVQAPAREALEMAGPSRRPSARPTQAVTARAAPAPAAAPVHHAPAPRADFDPRPRPPAPRHHRSLLPGVDAPAGGSPDVCALGRRFGGWSADSAEATICERTYGR
ncbi:hypothetical protein [Streptomyces mangrovisoli]|uniref:hypothetical protein n=1 Tax=Streptomyces mangrovisoli TaxID=1428628 RepID=UPI001F0A8D60|nr:hypothetical protein [Streptomyces mangrovisoli]